MLRRPRFQAAPWLPPLFPQESRQLSLSPRRRDGNVWPGPARTAISRPWPTSSSPRRPWPFALLTPAESRSLPPGGELTDRRYTQESVIAAGRKPRAQVLGEPVRVNGRMLSDGGYQLRQLDELLRAQRVATRLVIVDERMSEAEIRRDLVDNLQRPGDYVIVNYLRAALGQAGGGHISPLGAYDAATDSVLILDVHPSHYPWVWVPLATLVQGMRTRDMNENRGYILARPR